MAGALETARSFLGIAKEATSGTPVAPTDYFPIEISKLKPEDHDIKIMDTASRGSNVKNYGSIKGRRWSTFAMGGPVFADMIGYFLAGILGECVTTGASAPYTHVISTLNSATAGATTQPKSFTITDYNAVVARAYPGMNVEEVTFTFTKDGLLEFDAKLTGWGSADAATPTATFSGVLPVATWLAVFSIAGTSISNMVDGSITIKRAASVIHTSNGSRDPWDIFLGPVEVSAKFTCIMEDETQYVHFQNNDTPAFSISWSDGAGATATQVQAVFTKGAYTTLVTDRSKDYIEVQFTIEAQANTTDKGVTGMSPIKWTLQNAKVSGTYQ